MTKLEKQEEEISDEAGKFIIPGPKQAGEYDARSKSAESRAARRKKMVDFEAESLKLKDENSRKRAYKLLQDISNVEGVMCPQPKSLDEPSATVNLKTTTDSQPWTESRAETLEVSGPIIERLSPTLPFKDKVEFPNAVKDTPKKPSDETQAMAALRLVTDKPVPPGPETPTRAPNAQSLFVLPPKLNTMHGEDTDPRVLSHMTPGTPNKALTSLSGGLSHLGILHNSELLYIETVTDVVGDELTSVHVSAL